MRITLVFPPRTGPTYMPLSLACLAAVANSKKVALDVFDANLELWHHLCDSDLRLGAMRAFSHSQLDVFLNPKVYSARWTAAMPDARRRIDLLEQQARHYLAGHGLADDLRGLLSRQSARSGQATPEITALSVMYLDQLPFALALAKYLGDLRAGGRIVLGGAAMSALSPEELLAAAPFIDAVLTGEGEIPFAALLDGLPPDQIPGSYCRRRGAIEFSGRGRVLEHLGLLSMPDFSALATGGYFNPVPVMPIYGSRGCKWRRCRFCAHNNSFGQHRERPAMTVALEMQERRRQYGCRHFYMVDQYVDPVSLAELSDAILALGLDCRFQVMARTVGAYTPALLNKAAKAGCCWISWGMESGSRKLLDVMNKGTAPGPSLEVIRTAAAEGISNLLMMIFGAPGTDATCLDETGAFLEQAWPYIDSMTASAFVLFEQTEFGRHPGRYGLEIIGRHPMLELDGKMIHDQKLPFRRKGETDAGESPLALAEIDAWERRRAWLPPLPFHSQLCCEHYLLFADAAQANLRPGNNPRCA